ncbi:hypothetical protein JQC92_16865 [Shewanella sp. 202IG2-18]|uniref:DUF3024 domain-containing protein n=1 Tax=Parashewanella hymeniacidonis TaxID=2807618 RepID=UPI0019601F74|nr:hypothetical protein [Parashewanella hymeniacidonis]MBM7073683.1 hypothetical protein [Parashewanella hymeniacidonis]
MSKHKMGWQPTPTKPSTAFKNKISAEAAPFIEELKLKCVLPENVNDQFNYLIDIYGRWRGRYFYFCGKYHSPGPNAISPEFETKFARLEYMGEDNFNLAYMRHTGQWFELFQEQTLEQCFAEMKNLPHFMP